MDDAFEANHRKQSAGNRCGRNGAEDDQAKEAPGISPALALKKELGAGDLGVRGCHCEEREDEWRRSGQSGLCTAVRSCSKGQVPKFAGLADTRAAAGARVGAQLNHNPGLTIPSSPSTHLTARQNVLRDTYLYFPGDEARDKARRATL